jgi:uncharacterized protein (DUF934 family)
MRQLIKQREIVNDTWAYADDNSSANEVIVPFARFQQEHDRWLAFSQKPGQKLGVRLTPADDVQQIVKDLTRISLVALEFPGIGEGRGYSQAQLLRGRYGFKGEIRATGKILRDQVFHMARCGIDAFEFPQGTDMNVALTAFNDFTVAYQPSSDQAVKLQQRAG